MVRHVGVYTSFLQNFNVRAHKQQVDGGTGITRVVFTAHIKGGLKRLAKNTFYMFLDLFYCPVGGFGVSVAAQQNIWLASYSFDYFIGHSSASLRVAVAVQVPDTVQVKNINRSGLCFKFHVLQNTRINWPELGGIAVI